MPPTPSPRCDPERSYRVRGVRGDACYLSLTVYGGPRDGRWSDRIVATLNDRAIRFAPDGSFEVRLSRTSSRATGSGSIPTACAGDARLSGAPEGAASGDASRSSVSTTVPPPRLSDEDLARRFQAAANFIRDMLKITPLPLDRTKLNQIDEPYPVPQRTYGWAAADAAYAMGSFELGADEALVIEGRSPRCVFWNICLWNPYLQTYDYRYEQVTLNGGQVRYEPDGSCRIVIAARDPGVPNWISTADHPRGRIWFRWFLPESLPARPQASVMPIASLRSARVGRADEHVAAARFGRSPEVRGVDRRLTRSESLERLRAEVGGARTSTPDRVLGEPKRRFGEEKSESEREPAPAQQLRQLQEAEAAEDQRHEEREASFGLVEDVGQVEEGE